METRIDGFEIEGTQEEIVELIVKVRERERRLAARDVPYTGQPIHVIPYWVIPPALPWPMFVDPYRDTQISSGSTTGDVRVSVMKMVERSLVDNADVWGAMAQ